MDVITETGGGVQVHPGGGYAYDMNMCIVTRSIDGRYVGGGARHSFRTGTAPAPRRL